MPYLGSTTRIRNTMTDYDGKTPLTPDNQEIKIYDSAGVLKHTTTNPTLDSIGIYHVDYTIPSDAKPGNWRVIWKVEKAGKPTIGVFTFNVTAP